MLGRNQNLNQKHKYRYKLKIGFLAKNESLAKNERLFHVINFDQKRKFRLKTSKVREKYKFLNALCIF